MQRTIVVIDDDIDGGEAHQTVEFALDEATYEIDLNDDNAAALRSALAPYISAGRRQSRRRPRRSSKGTQARRSGTSEVREWARANGHEVSDRGPISAEIKAEWERSQRKVPAGDGG